MTDYELFELTRSIPKDDALQELIKKGLAYENKVTKTAFMISDDKKEKIRYILCRETSGTLLDWAWNMVACKVRDNRRIKQHAGFLACYLSIHQSLNRAIKESPYTKIRFVGFSKGGAIAQKAFERLPDIHKSKDFISPAIFGSPRLYSWWSVRKLPQRLREAEGYRYRSDLVTFVPFFFLGYRHAIKIIPLKRRRIFPLPWWPFDHYPERYEKELREN